MSEITEQEASEAADIGDASSMRLASMIRNGEQSTNEFASELEMLDKAWGTLRGFLTQEFSRRDAERIERAKPITAEWCLANGAEGYEAGFEMVYGWDLGWCEFNWREERGCRLYIGDFHFHVNLKHETVGQLDDLLKALRGGT